MVIPDHPLAKLRSGEPPFLASLHLDQSRIAQPLIRGGHGGVQPVRFAEERVYPRVCVAQQVEQNEGVYRMQHRRIWVEASLGEGVRGREERVVPFFRQVSAVNVSFQHSDAAIMIRAETLAHLAP
jgi:hypothetical protein